MGLWAEPFTTLQLQKIFNLYQDPFERADITSNTFWDWQINHVASMYGVMDNIFEFATTFKDFPPRSFPPALIPQTSWKRKWIKSNAGKPSRSRWTSTEFAASLNQIIEKQFRNTVCNDHQCRPACPPRAGIFYSSLLLKFVLSKAVNKGSTSNATFTNRTPNARCARDASYVGA